MGVLKMYLTSRKRRLPYQSSTGHDMWDREILTLKERILIHEEVRK